MRLLRHFATSLLESILDLTPIVVVIAFFQLFVLQQSMPNLGPLPTDTLLVILGLSLFVQGLNLAPFPLVEGMAWDFSRKGSVKWLLLFASPLDFGTTAAEPALIKIAEEMPKIDATGGIIEATQDSQISYAKGLRGTLAFSVGFAIVLGVLRILKGRPVQYLFNTGYLGVVTIEPDHTRTDRRGGPLR
jgi:hypothetical protein